MDWHGYPQEEGANAVRPWWRAADLADAHREERTRKGQMVYVPPCPGWRRMDGQEVALIVGSAARTTEEVAAEMERIDREHPLPMPELRCQQVWAAPVRDGAGGGHRTIVGVDPDGAIYTAGFDGVTRYPRGMWPKAHAVLVAGPGAPWGPSDAGEEP